MQPDLFTTPPRVLTVGEFTLGIQTCLAAAFPMLWVSGEVSGLKRHQNGHLYFTLKDAEATLPCVVWRKAARLIEQLPQEGDHVEVLGRLDLYPPHGRYQFLIDNLRPRGRGELYAAFERLKAKLAAQGLFAPERKRPLPALPRRIGIVTSPTGAALRDMLKLILARDPLAQVVIAPALVQGRGAAGSIRTALQQLARVPGVDVVIAGRGGGALEDLWPFNEEAVVRAIFDHPVPVVSAVGHESDITISDLVADVRASTPSHAAELVTPRRALLLAEVAELGRRLGRAATRRLAEARGEVALLAEQLPDPGQLIDPARAELQQLSARLAAGPRRALRTQVYALAQLDQRLAIAHPKAQLAAQGAALRGEQSRLQSAFLARLLRARDQVRAQRVLLDAYRARLLAAQEALQRRAYEQLGRLADQLRALSPLDVLARGYALATQNGRPVRDPRTLAPGDEFHLRFAQGQLRARALPPEDP